MNFTDNLLAEIALIADWCIVVDKMLELLAHLTLSHSTQVLIDYALPVLCVLGVTWVLHRSKGSRHCGLLVPSRTVHCVEAVIGGVRHKRSCYDGGGRFLSCSRWLWTVSSVVAMIVHHIVL